MSVGIHEHLQTDISFVRIWMFYGAENVMKWSVDKFKNYGSKIGLILMRSIEILVIAYALMYFILYLMFKYVDLDK